MKALAEDAHVPVMMVTAFGDFETMRQSAECGADGFISKPADLRELALRVETMIRTKRVVDELYAKNRELEELGRFKESLLSMTAHDLKGPLTGIRGFAELTLHKLEDPQELKELMHDILLISSYMGNLLENLLNLSLIRSGSLELDIVPVALKTVVEESLRLLKYELQGRKLELRLEDMQVAADRGRLRRVFVNLLGNAVKFSPPEKPIHVTTRRSDGFAQVLIRDEGIGIPRSLLPRLFEPFYRAARKEIRSVPGSGLGLHIARCIIERHGGRIEVKSRVGLGSLFTFTIPLS